MKIKNGFTLIELLAVIVVLAIIALIATPIVMNTIKNSKKGAAERGADNYVEQVETSLMTYRLENGENLPNGTYSIDSNGNLTGNGLSDSLTIEMNGTKPSSGSIVIDNGGVNKEKTTMKVGDYDISYDTDNKTFVATESTENNVEVLCKAVTELSTQYVYNQGNIQTGVLASAGDPYAYGVEYTCELGDNDAKTFYVLENNEDTVSLIMNMNVGEDGKETTSGNTVAWSSDGSTANGPVTALEYLSSSTASWTKLNPSQISLPSGQQIAIASGQTFNQSYISELPTWLYENLNVSEAPYAYWTTENDGVMVSWVINQEGSLTTLVYVENSWSCDTFVYRDNYYGIRPVITVSKTQLG